MVLRLNVDPAGLSTAQQKGNRVFNDTKTGKPRVMYYTKAKVQHSHDVLMMALEEALQAPELQEELLQWKGLGEGDAWWMRVTFVYKPKSLDKHRSMLGRYKLTKPDGDNLMKLIPDIITKMGFAWVDDKQMQCGGIYRRFVCDLEDEPHIVVELKTLQDWGVENGIPK